MPRKFAALLLGLLVLGPAYLFSGETRGSGKGTPVFSKEKILLGGATQTVLIRGRNRKNPVLLFLHGGPGYSEMPYAPLFQAPLEKHFTVVQWDQRGTGQSYAKDIPKDSMTLDQIVADACELAEVLKKRFGQKKIYLIGHSWGTIVGMNAAARHPELFYAYVGMGQVTDVERSEKASFEFTVRQARQTQNEAALRELSQIGEPPYYNFSIKNLNVQRKWLLAFGGSFREPSSDQKCSRAYLSSPESKSMDPALLEESIRFSMETLAPDILKVNFFRQIPELKVPVYFLLGRSDYTTSSVLAEEYFRQLSAPRKELVWFERSGHHPHFEEPERFAEVLTAIARAAPGK